MEFDKIKQLMQDMSNSKLIELEIELSEGIKISMKKESFNKISNNQDENLKITDINQQINKSDDVEKNRNIITSPMVGTFYLKPSPTSNPYVEIGKEIKRGETICIIEAMKLMNEIESEYSGIIREILVKDGEPVEFGTEMFVIE